MSGYYGLTREPQTPDPPWVDGDDDCGCTDPDALCDDCLYYAAKDGASDD